VTTHSEKCTKQNLAARKGGDPEWVKSEITCGSVRGASREGPQNKAAMRLLEALAMSSGAATAAERAALPSLKTFGDDVKSL